MCACISSVVCAWYALSLAVFTVPNLMILAVIQLMHFILFDDSNTFKQLKLLCVDNLLYRNCVLMIHDSFYLRQSRGQS